MSKIEVNEGMTKLVIAAHNVAKMKRDEPEAYDFIMREVINNARRSLESSLEGQDELTAMFSKSVMEAIYSRIYNDPFAMVEIEQMIQKIDHKKKEDKES